MSPETVMGVARQALQVTLLVSLPILGIGLVVGVVVSMVQAATQIQEMTLTFVPKIVAVMLALLFFSSWMLIKITDYTNDLFLSIPYLIR
jgi:flagellar biosynthetic protein FliQ